MGHLARHPFIRVLLGDGGCYMKSFKEFLEFVGSRKTPSEKLVIYHFYKDDPIAEFIVRALLNEQCPSVDLGRGRSILFHKAHVPNTEDHLHFLVKGAKIAAINKSGSAHDRSHGVRLQRWALDGMKQYYPDFTVPPEGLIEALMDESSSHLLTEAFDPQEVLVPRAVRFLAEQKAKR
jgi:hypothetical protein